MILSYLKAFHRAGSGGEVLVPPLYALKMYLRLFISFLYPPGFFSILDCNSGQFGFPSALGRFGKIEINALINIIIIIISHKHGSPVIRHIMIS